MVVQKEVNERKSAHYLSKRFQKDDPFTGKLGEDILDYFNNYEEAFQDYCFDNDQMLKYLLKKLEGKAKCHFCEQDNTQCGNYFDAKKFNKPIK